jgi:creatinine amidohydrolase
VTIYLEGAAWPAVEHVPSDRTLVVVPLGSTEQHGPHLPFDTDTRIATAVARRVASAGAPGRHSVLAPSIGIGASGEHQDFAGTLSIGTRALTELLVELGRSATVWAGRVLLVTGHGGNVAAVTAATRRLVDEGRDVAWVPAVPAEAVLEVVSTPDAHAGRVETSLMLRLDPSAVDLPAARPGRTTPLDILMPDLRANGVRAVAPSGVLGDPAGANAREGAALLAAAVGEVSRRVRHWQRRDTGLLGAPQAGVVRTTVGGRA